MIIAVGSENPVKVNAVKEIMSTIYGNVEIFSYSVDSGVSSQPTSLEEIIEGAINRARNVILKNDNATFGVGIEAGITPVPHTITGYLDFAYCAIIDRDMKITLGASPGFECPPIVIKKIFSESKEVGEIFDELLHEKDVKKRMGAVGYLTHGLLNRLEFVKLSVLMAMVPRLKHNHFSYF